MRSFWLGLVLVVAGCAPATTRPVVLELRAEVGGEPFECGRVYEGVGTSGTAFTPHDFRLFVHDVRALTEDGEVAITLDGDGAFQGAGVALIDFETGGAACLSGDARTNTTLRGTVPIGTGPLTGVRFVVGVPADRNHVDGAAQPPPLNTSSLFWGWSAGYDFIRVGGASTGLSGGFEVLLGAMACTGDAREGTRTCAVPNRPEVTLTGDVEAGIIVADLARLFADVDLDRNAGGPPGCMSDEGDPECEPIFTALGLAETEQTFFTLDR